MARCRNIKPGFFTNELLAELPALTRLLFAGLWLVADRDGRLEDRPNRIKAQILPFDIYDVDEALDQLSRGDDPFVVRYQVGVARYIQVVKFRDHQYADNREKPSVIPGLHDNTNTTHGVDETTIKVQRFRGSEVQRKGDARGKPKRIEAASIPVPEGFETPEVRAVIADWLSHKAKLGSPYKDAGYLGRKVAEFTRAGPAVFIAAVNSSIGNNYSGIFAAKESHGNQSTTRRIHRHRAT